MTHTSNPIALRNEPFKTSDVAEVLTKRLFKAAVKAAWAARGRTEELTVEPGFEPPDRLYYCTEDGWESPLWHYPAALGSTGEPVVLAHGLATGAAGFDYDGKRSLARALARAGYSVYVLEHRGDRHSIPPEGSHPFDLDDIISQDIPAALARIREHSTHPRALWIGHSLGGQVLVGHLARQGCAEVAAGVLICTPVRFDVPRSTARLAVMASRLLPEGWTIPTRRIHQALAPFGIEPPTKALSNQLEGPLRRGIWLHAANDLSSGLIRQLATCIRSGALVDRDDRVDYLTAMRHAQVPLLAIAAAGDPACPPASAYPVLDHLPPHAKEWLELDERWSHLDPVLSHEAVEEIHPSILSWLERWRSSCWSD